VKKNHRRKDGLVEVADKEKRESRSEGCEG